MQRIRRHHPSLQVQQREHGLGGGDLVGLVGYAHLQQGLLTLVGVDRQQVGSGLLSDVRPAHGLAVDGDRLGVRHGPRGTHPAGQRPFQRLDRQAGQEATIERAAGGQ